uniref:EamA domain-containing protein n=1 Tax=Strongyloides papillosus TaxID=174720 RepID=A0A0N5BWE0_STREA
MPEQIQFSSATTTSNLYPLAIQQAETEDSEEGYDCCCCLDNFRFKRTLKAICYGQILSLCLCGTGIGSQYLSEFKVNTPMAQSFLNYFFLSFVYGLGLIFSDGSESFFEIIKDRGWKYLLLGIIDVEANYLVVWAYQFTNLTSIQLLDCSVIPFVMILSYLFLRVRYLTFHIVGVALCLLGIAFLIWADVLENKNGSLGESNKFLGDCLCIASSALYALSNTGEEKLVKNYSRNEYLGIVGIIGFIISGIQLAIFERNNLAEVNWTWKVIAMYLLYSVSMFIFYSMVSIVLQKTSALMFNLSILTADFYSLIAGIFLFHYQFHILYFISFAVVIFGSIIYSIKETEIAGSNEDFCKPLRKIVSNFGSCNWSHRHNTTATTHTNRNESTEASL